MARISIQDMSRLLRVLAERERELASIESHPSLVTDTYKTSPCPSHETMKALCLQETSQGLPAEQHVRSCRQCQGLMRSMKKWLSCSELDKQRSEQREQDRTITDENR